MALGLAGCAWAGGPITWTFSAKPAGKDTVQLLLTAGCEPGWHIYALALPSEEGPLPTTVEVPDQPGFRLAGHAREPMPVEVNDPNFGVPVRYHSGTSTFSQALLRKSGQPFTVTGMVEYMACNDKTCLPPHTVEFTVAIPSPK